MLSLARYLLKFSGLFSFCFSTHDYELGAEENLKCFTQDVDIVWMNGFTPLKESLFHIDLKNIVLATDYSIHGKNFKTEDVEHAKFYYILPLRYAWNYVWQRYKFGSGFNINEYYPYYSKSLKFGDISGLLGSLLARGTLSYMEWRKAENLYYLNDGRYENPNPRRGRFK